MRRVPAAIVVLALVLIGVGCSSGDDDENAEETDCPPTTTAAQPSGTTTTVDPGCVESAVEGTNAPEEPQDDVWEGTIESTVTTQFAGAACPNPTTVTGTARLEVEPGGTVTGTYDVSGCGVSMPHAEFTGTATEDGFTFPELIVFTNGELIPKVSPERAEARLRNVQGGTVQWVTSWDLRCVSC